MQYKFLPLYGTTPAQLETMCNQQAAAGWTLLSAVTIYSVSYFVFTKSGLAVGVTL